MTSRARFRFLADQFRAMPEPAASAAANNGVYGGPEQLRSYSEQLGEGLYDSEEEFLRRGHLEAGQDLLDVGCGAGREAQGFRRRGLRVTAIDSTPAMLERARELARGTDIRFQVAGLARLDFPERSFDAAYLSSNVYAETPGRRRRVAALAQFRRLLRHGGRVIFPVSIKPAHSWKVRVLVDGPLSLLRRAWPERTLETGDRYFRSGPGMPPLLTHLFRDAGEVKEEIADAGLALVDRVGDFFVARTPGGDQRFRCPAGIHSAPTGADLLVLDVGNGAAFRLNHTAHAMWTHLALGKTIPATAAALGGVLGAPRERLEADAVSLVVELIQTRLLEPRVESGTREGG